MVDFPYQRTYPQLAARAHSRSGCSRGATTCETLSHELCARSPLTSLRSRPLSDYRLNAGPSLSGSLGVDIHFNLFSTTVKTPIKRP